jgi:hypothetical protein
MSSRGYIFMLVECIPDLYDLDDFDDEKPDYVDMNLEAISLEGPSVKCPWIVIAPPKKISRIHQ